MAKNFKTKLKYEVKTLTKDDAREILENHNHMNRPMNNRVCSLYMKDMNDGTFVYNGQGEILSFDSNGELLNGQHRLKAFIDSNIEKMEWLIVRDVKTEHFATFDGGRNRNAQQILAISGCKKPAVASTMIKLLQTYRTGKQIKRIDAFVSATGGAGFLKTDVNSIYLKNQSMYDSIVEHFSKIGKKTQYSVPALCAVAYILLDDEFELCYSPEDVYGFLDSIINMDTAKYPIIKELYRKREEVLRENVRERNSFACQCFEMIAQAWNKRKSDSGHISCKIGRNSDYTKIR